MILNTKSVFFHSIISLYLIYLQLCNPDEPSAIFFPLEYRFLTINVFFKSYSPHCNNVCCLWTECKDIISKLRLLQILEFYLGVQNGIKFLYINFIFLGQAPFITTVSTSTPTTTAQKPVLAGATIPITPVTSSLTAPGAAGEGEGDEEGDEIGEEEEENEVEEIGEEENLEFFTIPITAPTTTIAN